MGGRKCHDGGISVCMVFVKDLKEVTLGRKVKRTTVSQSWTERFKLVIFRDVSIHTELTIGTD